MTYEQNGFVFLLLLSRFVRNLQSRSVLPVATRTEAYNARLSVVMFNVYSSRLLSSFSFVLFYVFLVSAAAQELMN
jgi:hypothetical protein